MFDQTSKLGQKLTKTFFLPIVSHIQLNYAFLLFWSIVGEIHRELLFLVKKVATSERRSEIPRKFVFRNMFEKGKSWVKLGFVYTALFDQTSKWGQKLTKTVFLPIVSHIQLNYAFLLFWNIFGEIHRELLFLVKKATISERSIEILRKFVFLNMYEKGKSWVKLGFV